MPGFGDRAARVLVVGLAPGAHGSNRTGRMFTGDSSGDFLYAALHRAGFTSQPTATHRNDGLTLRDVFITAVGRCAPPGNKPAPGEIANCLPYLQREIALLPNVRAVVTLGKIAFDNMLGLYAATSQSKIQNLKLHLPDSLTGQHTPLAPACQPSSPPTTPAGRTPRPGG